MLRWFATVVRYVAVTAIAVLAVLTPALQLVNTVAQHTARTPDFVSTYVDSFRASKERLANADVVGYLTDQQVDTTRGSRTTMRYYLAQYALAPLLVDAESREYDVVIVNFPPDRAGLLGRLRRNPQIARLEQVDVPGRAIAFRSQP